jgi:hypothetical protein
MNDPSNNQIKFMSKSMLLDAGIYQFAKKKPATGMRYLFSADTQKLLSKLSVDDSNEEIEKVYKDAISKG